MGSNTEKLIGAFVNALEVEASAVVDGLTYGAEQWDSVSHMALVVELEDAFGIMLDTQDILDMSSVAKAREILRKYDVDIPA